MGETAYYDIRLRVFDRPLDSLESKMNRVEGKVGGLKSSFGGLGGSIAGAFAGGLVAGGVASLLSSMKDLSTEAITVTREFNNMKEAIMFASGENAAKNISFLDSEINRLGLDVQSTYKGFKTFQGALMGTRLEGEAGLEIFKAVSEAASVMKLSAEQTEGTFLALGQMISKGSVQAEELRGQLGERLPGAFQIFARSLGVSTSELGGMLKAGEVMSEDALPKFAAELRKTFSPGVSKAQQSFNADMNRFSNFILQAKLNLGNQLIPTLHELIKIIPQIDFTPITQSFNDLNRSFSEAFSLLGDLLKMIGLNTDGFTVFQGVVSHLGWLFRVATTPIRIFLQAVKLVVSAVTDAAKVLGEFVEMHSNMFQGDFKAAANNYRRMQNFWKDTKSTIAATVEEIIDREKEGWSAIFNPMTAQNGSTSLTGAPGMMGGSGSVSQTSSGSATKPAGVEKISSATRNITLNITKLVENITFVKDQNRNEYDMEEMVKRVLLKAVNDVNIVAS